MLRVIIILSTLIGCSLALQCYDCFDTGPDHSACTKERNCTGKACLIFDAGDGHALTAFCLLATKNDEKSSKREGCWSEANGVGKHCICHTDYCNKLEVRQIPAANSADPLLLSIGGAQMLKGNPLIDYDDEDAEVNAAPLPESVLFPGAAKGDPHVAGDQDEDDDLVPVSFEEYDQQTKLKETKAEEKPLSHHENDIGDDNKATRTDVSSSSGPPPCVLFFLTMAASWARLFVGI